MPGFSDAAELSVLRLIFEGTAWADVAENDATSPATNVYVSLHTADPADAGAQNANEATYTGYARKAVARTSAQWTVATSAGVTTSKNTNAVTFDACTGGSNTITHAGIGFTSSGASVLLASGALTSSLAVSNGITPSFAALALSFSLD